MKGRWGVEENTVLCGSGQMGKGLGTAGGISGQGSLPSLSLARCMCQKGFPGGSVVKNPPAKAGDMGLIPGLGRSPGGGKVNPL